MDNNSNNDMSDFYKEQLALLANILQVANFMMNIQQISNDEIMKMLEKQNTDYLEKLLLKLDEQNNNYFERILARLDNLEKKIDLMKGE